jgi:UDP-N-acetylmuramate dehydrogenase
VPKPVLSYKDLAQAFPDGIADQQAIRSTIIDIRGKKFPDWTRVGTAGSFFKNPIITNEQYEVLTSKYPELPGFPVDGEYTKIPLGYVLDKILNLRGVQEGAVGTYEGQALVLLNKGGATAADITSFAESIVTTVKDAIDVSVEWEVTRW